jgi:predicted amidohydrolase
MVIAAAQINPIREGLNQNLETHYNLIKLAVGKGVRLIAFPELSITGYEREEANKLSFSISDDRLNILKELSAEHNMIIIAGAPIKMDTGLYIGSFVIFPDKSVSIYTKQYLHTGEELFYKPSFDFNPLIELEGEHISLAICADIDHPEHAENAGKKKSSFYIPSIFFSPKGIGDAYQKLSSYAARHSMNVLMSNFCVTSYGSDAGGKSGLWNKKGKLIAQLDNMREGLVMATGEGENWTGEAIYLS